MKYSIENAGSLDGVKYYNIVHNDNIIGTYPLNNIKYLEVADLIDDLIEDFYENNPLLSKGE